MTAATIASLQSASRNVPELSDFIGRHTDKTFDWDAFPSGRGYPELDRGQMRYVGGGGSPKVNEPGVLKPGQFTLSLVYQEVGKYAPSHSHECVEHFMVLEGVLTVGWVYGDEVIEAKLGPGDLVLNKMGRPHGFRNDGPNPVLMTITVGSATPLPPVFAFHPEGNDPERSRLFGAAPGKTYAFRPASNDWRQQEVARHLVRRRDLKPIWNDAGIARMIYIGEGGAEPQRYRMDLIRVPSGAGVRAYNRQVEDVFFVLKGCLTVGWVDASGVAQDVLRPKDLVFNPEGTSHFFRNDGPDDVEFLMVVGTREPEDVHFEPADK